MADAIVIDPDYIHDLKGVEGDDVYWVCDNPNCKMGEYNLRSCKGAC